MDEYKYLFKVVLVGNAGVGKTCLGIFPPGQSATIGVDFMIKTLKIRGDRVKLQIWDTAGQERFRSITQSYYRSAHAIVLTYDVSSQPTFDCIGDWINEIEQYANKKALKILVGNKMDKDDEEREVPTHIGEAFAAANGFDYFIETSAVNSANVDLLFEEVATRLADEAKQNEERYGGGQPKTRPAGTTNASFTLVANRAQQQMRQMQTRCCGGSSNPANA